MDISIYDTPFYSYHSSLSMSFYLIVEAWTHWIWSYMFRIRNRP